MVWKSISIDVLVKMYEMNPTLWGLFPEAHWVSEVAHDEEEQQVPMTFCMVTRKYEDRRDKAGET